MIQQDVLFSLEMAAEEEQERQSALMEDNRARYSDPVRHGKSSPVNAKLEDGAFPVPLPTFDPKRPSISATEQEWEEHILPGRLAAWEAGERRTFSLEEVGAELIALREALAANRAA